MSWQDIVISIANVIFTVSLAVQVYYGFREKTGPIKYQASIPTSIGLYAISLCYWTLGLYFSTGIALVNATLWFILSLQRKWYHHPLSK